MKSTENQNKLRTESYSKIVKKTKQNFFNQKIQEIINRKSGLWNLMNWVNKHKLPVVEAIKYNNQPCLEIHKLWNTYSTFKKAQDQQIDSSLLDELPSKKSVIWLLFFEAEFNNAICKCNNSSTSGSDKLSWRHLKIIMKDIVCLKNIINIADSCFKIGFWPLHFKISTSIIIPKPNKKLYDSSKSFRPIVLLNTIGKLIEKAIGKRLQF